MINPALLLSPSGQPGIMTPTQDALNGAFTGNYSGIDPTAGQVNAVDLTSIGLPYLGQGPTLVAPGAVSPAVLGASAVPQILGSPATIGPSLNLSGVNNIGDSGVLSAQTQVAYIGAYSGDPGASSLAGVPGAGLLTIGDPGTAATAPSDAAAPAPAPAPAS